MSGLFVKGGVMIRKIQETVNYDMSMDEPYLVVEYIFRCADCLHNIMNYCDREYKVVPALHTIPSWCTLADAPKEKL